jgi:hypothetical protein
MEPFGERKQGIDVHGQPFTGTDDDGKAVWWGTERAAWKLSDAETVVRVYGKLRSGLDWDGFFLATEEEAVAYAEAHEVTVTRISAAKLKGYDAFNANL